MLARAALDYRDRGLGNSGLLAKSARLERGRPPGPARLFCGKAVRAVFLKVMAQAQDDRELVARTCSARTASR